MEELIERKHWSVSEGVNFPNYCCPLCGWHDDALVWPWAFGCDLERCKLNFVLATTWLHRDVTGMMARMKGIKPIKDWYGMGFKDIRPPYLTQMTDQ